MTVKIYVGDCRDVLKTLPDESVHCCVTSPPYWGLRDYGTEPQVWGGDAECPHEWGYELPPAKKSHTNEGFAERVGSQYRGGGHKADTGTLEQRPSTAGQFCQLCGAWRGSLGLEPTIEMYCANLVEIFREVRRVLRDDGTLWLNLGDSYCSIGHKKSHSGFGTTGLAGGKAQEHHPLRRENDAASLGLKHKDLCGIPWRVAFALQSDGWWLRRDIIWAKGVSFLESYAGSSMPESCQDRPSSSHEYVFLLAKSARYFYDIEAVKEQAQEPHAPGNLARQGILNPHGGVPTTPETDPNRVWGSGKRNLRSVWVINPGNYPGSHFAVMPVALVEPMILAGTSERGCCPECGAVWKRVMEKGVPCPEPDRNPAKRLEPGQAGNVGAGNMGFRASRLSGQEQAAWKAEHPDKTTGWQPTCDCNMAYPGLTLSRNDPAYVPYDPVPCIALDPFAGAGTTGLVADRLGRDAILIDLSPDYAQMSKERIEGDAPMFVDVQLVDAEKSPISWYN